MRRCVPFVSNFSLDMVKYTYKDAMHQKAYRSPKISPLCGRSSVIK